MIGRETRVLLRHYLEQGMSKAAIARELGINRRTVHNPDPKRKYEALVACGKPSKVALTAVMRKLLVLANALVQQDRIWTTCPPREYCCPAFPTPCQVGSDNE